MTFDILTLLENLEHGIPTSYIRYGDGELKCIFQPSSRRFNCDGQRYYPGLSNRLREVLDAQNVEQTMHIGLREHTPPYYPQFRETWPNIEWCSANIFHRESMKNRMPRFMNAIDRYILLIGPKRITPAMDYFGITDFGLIDIPEEDCAGGDGYGKTLQETKYCLHYCDSVVVMVCAGLMAGPLIHDLQPDFPQNFYLDMGSVFEPYAGVKNRTYHRNILRRIQAEKCTT